MRGGGAHEGGGHMRGGGHLVIANGESSAAFHPSNDSPPPFPCPSHTPAGLERLPLSGSPGRCAPTSSSSPSSHTRRMAPLRPGTAIDMLTPFPLLLPTYLYVISVPLYMLAGTLQRRCLLRGTASTSLRTSFPSTCCTTQSITWPPVRGESACVCVFAAMQCNVMCRYTRGRARIGPGKNWAGQGPKRRQSLSPDPHFMCLLKFQVSR